MSGTTRSEGSDNSLKDIELRKAVQINFVLTVGHHPDHLLLFGTPMRLLLLTDLVSGEKDGAKLFLPSNLVGNFQTAA